MTAASFAAQGTPLVGSGQGAAPAVRDAGRSSHVKTAPASDPLTGIGRQIPLPIPVPDWSKPIIIVLLLLAIWFGVRSRLAARRARGLEGQRATLLHDVGVMQAALVPELPAALGGLAVSVAYRPADGPAAGGDFYDLFVPGPGKVAVILGDVCGHGCEALTHAALTRYTLRAYLQAGLEPRAALALAGRVLADPAGEHYATVALGVYDSRTSRLTYATAGHPPPLFQGFQAREPLTICSSPPIGWGVPTGRRQSLLSLPPGAAVCFFSDGLIEARAGEQLLGRERLAELLAELGPGPLATDLLERVREVARSTPDDMAACVLQAQTGVGVVQPQVEELEADARALDGPHVRSFLEACELPRAQVVSAIELGRGIAAEFDAALLRVQFGPAGTAVEVVVPDADTPEVKVPRVPQLAAR